MGGGEGAAGLGGATARADLREGKDVGQGEGEVTDGVAGSGGSEGGPGAVVDEEAAGGVKAMGEGHTEAVGADAARDLLGGED